MGGTWLLWGCHICCRGDSAACDKPVSLVLASEAAASRALLPTSLGPAVPSTPRMAAPHLERGWGMNPARCSALPRMRPWVRSCCLISFLTRGGGIAAALLIAEGSCFRHRLPQAANHPALPCSRHRAGHHIGCVTVCSDIGLTPGPRRGSDER